MDGEFLPFSVAELGPLAKEEKDFWYRPLGRAPMVRKGEIVLVGRKATGEDWKEVARGTFFLGGLTTLLKRAPPDLFLDAGAPFVVIMAADVNIPVAKVPLVDITPMCPCEDKKVAPLKKDEPL